MSLLSFLDREHTIAKPGFSRWMVPPMVTEPASGAAPRGIVALPFSVRFVAAALTRASTLA